MKGLTQERRRGMREIKFRAWDKENKRFQSFEKDRFHLVIMLNGEFRVQPGNGTSSNFSIEKFVLQQFTDLHDKNGKEIYEGDMVRHSPISEILIVEFRDGAFGYEYYKQFIKQTNMQKYIAEWEVIGNIYSNPELLNQKG